MSDLYEVPVDDLMSDEDAKELARRLNDKERSVDPERRRRWHIERPAFLSDGFTIFYNSSSNFDDYVYQIHP